MADEQMPWKRDVQMAAREHGWGQELIDRADSLGVPDSMREDWLRSKYSVKQVTEALDRYAEITYGVLRQREALHSDNEKLAELFASSPERIGEWEVTVERSPYAFAQFRLQENPQIQVLEEQGNLLAVMSRSTRETLIGGRRINVRYALAARVRLSDRGRGLGLYVTSGTLACIPYASAEYWFIRSQNLEAREWMRRNKFASERLNTAASREGDEVTVSYIPAKAFGGEATGIRPLQDEDVSACIDLINRTHDGQDLFQPYTVEFFSRRMNDGGRAPKPTQWVHVYDSADYWVVEEEGRIIACAGLWDRGRHIRERWQHRESGRERVREVTALLDFGFAEGREDTMARLVEYLVGKTQSLGRTHLMAPLQQLPGLAESVEHLEPVPDTWSMVWGWYDPPEDSGLPERLPIANTYVDLVYW